MIFFFEIFFVSIFAYTHADDIDFGKIAGGDEAEKGEWPWHVGILDKKHNYYRCAGTIIDSLWVLTAAHCVDGVTADGIQIVAGDHNQNEFEGEHYHDVERIVKHEKWSSFNLANDIAVVKVSDRFVYKTKKIGLINLLRTTDSIIENEEAKIAGWGMFAMGGKLSEVLHTTNVHVLPDENCKKKYKSQILPGMICAGTDDGSKEACQGDSGGGLIVQRNNVNYQVGIISWGVGCGNEKYPGVYTNVAYYNNWIKSKIYKN